MVLILAETAAGYAVFKAKDKVLKNKKGLADDLAAVENATSMYSALCSLSIRLFHFPLYELTLVLLVSD